MACHMPAACVLVCTITDIFISQSTSSVPKAHFRINLPETYKKNTSNHYVIVFIRHIHSSTSVITLDTAKLDFYVLLFFLLSVGRCLFMLRYYIADIIFIFILFSVFYFLYIHFLVSSCVRFFDFPLCVIFL